MAYLVASAQIRELALELCRLAARITAAEQVLGCVLEGGCVVARRELRRIIAEKGPLAGQEVVGRGRAGITLDVGLGCEAGSQYRRDGGGRGVWWRLPPESKSSKDGNLSAMVDVIVGVGVEGVGVWCWRQARWRAGSMRSEDGVGVGVGDGFGSSRPWEVFGKSGAGEQSLKEMSRCWCSNRVGCLGRHRMQYGLQTGTTEYLPSPSYDARLPCTCYLYIHRRPLEATG